MPGSAGPMGERIPPLSRPDASTSGQIKRVTADQRWTHRAVAFLVIVLIITAICLYVPMVSAAVGQRQLFRQLHILAGFALPVPILVSLLFAPSRRDYSRLNRMSSTDWRWLRGPNRPAIPAEKFNGGQKLYSAVSLGWILVMFATGLMLAYNTFFADQWRAGASFVHDWLALAVVVLVAGHMYKAWEDPEARRGLRTGWVSHAWAQRHHATWAQRHQHDLSPNQSNPQMQQTSDAKNADTE